MICQPVLNMALIVDLFAPLHPNTITRWNRADKTKPGRSLPAPDLCVGGVDLWSVETVLSWADGVGLKVDRGVLGRIMVEQS